MQIILSNQCESLTGSLGRGFGYAIVKRGNRYFAQRGNHNVSIPPDGHLRFILACAQLAQNGLHIADVCVSAKELRLAFDEAHLFYGDRLVKAKNKQIYNAGEVLKFKNCCSL